MHVIAFKIDHARFIYIHVELYTLLTRVSIYFLRFNTVNDDIEFDCNRCGQHYIIQCLKYEFIYMTKKIAVMT